MMVHTIKPQLMNPTENVLSLGKMRIGCLEGLHHSLQVLPDRHLSKKKILGWLEEEHPHLMMLHAELKDHKGNFQKKAVSELGKTISYLKGEENFEDYAERKCKDFLASRVEVHSKVFK